MIRLICLLLFTLLVASCTAPAPDRSTLPAESTAAPPQKSVPKTGNSKASAPVSIVPSAIPVQEWVGKSFYMLTKQQLIKSSGYNLYSCLHEGCDTVPIHAEWELPNRRIRCEQLENETLTVTDVSPDSTEWIITFSWPAGKKTIYAKTHKQALQECVLLEDLEDAKKRWINTFVFSKKGTILQKSDSKPSITSRKVNILDSLQVIDIKWGTTPLPVKPLWLHVLVRSSGEYGFIPVRYSWTNTMSDRISEEAPWNEDIFESDPRTLFDWDAYTWEVINNHRVILEMTPEQVRLSWGPPVSISSNLTSPDTKVYTYPSHILIFEQGQLVKINNAN